MSDDSNTTQGGQTSQSGQAVATASSTDIVIDKNKSPEQYMTDAESRYIVPKLVRDKFPDLVKLIYETESMNVEEREYWMQIMPIMSEEQIVKFRDILVNEKEQLAKLDTEYNNEISRIKRAQPPQIDEEKLREKISQIKKAEEAHKEEEKVKEEDLLKQLEGLD